MEWPSWRSVSGPIRQGDRGIATDAVLAVWRYLVEQLHVDREIAIVEPANAPAIRMVEKAGMVFERHWT